MLINMGVSILMFFLTLIFIGILLLLIKLTIKQRLFKKLVNHFHTMLVYNGIIRVLIETYLEFALTAFVNVQYMRFDYVGEGIAAVISVIFSVVLIVQPFLIVHFMRKNKAKLIEESF